MPEVKLAYFSPCQNTEKDIFLIVVVYSEVIATFAFFR